MRQARSDAGTAPGAQRRTDGSRRTERVAQRTPNLGEAEGLSRSNPGENPRVLLKGTMWVAQGASTQSGPPPPDLSGVLLGVGSQEVACWWRSDVRGGSAMRHLRLSEDATVTGRMEMIRRVGQSGLSAAMVLTLLIAVVPMVVAQPATGLLQPGPSLLNAPGCPASAPERCADGQCAASCRTGPYDPKRGPRMRRAARLQRRRTAPTASARRRAGRVRTTRSGVR